MNVAPAKAGTETTKKGKDRKKPPQIIIHEAFCKGCGICVAFCPTEVLVMKEGKVAVANLKACTSCGFCELRCPDFAIAVNPAEE